MFKKIIGFIIIAAAIFCLIKAKEANEEDDLFWRTIFLILALNTGIRALPYLM